MDLSLKLRTAKVSGKPSQNSRKDKTRIGRVASGRKQSKGARFACGYACLLARSRASRNFVSSERCVMNERRS